MQKTRLEAFSDGVIAIIITIMVLEFKMPHEKGWEALKPLLPVFISYVLSFIYVGIYWGNHHNLLHTVKKVNGWIMWANLHLLFWLSLLPFATSWMGENFYESFSEAFYGFILLMCGFAYDLLRRAIEKIHSNNEQLQCIYANQRTKGYVSLGAYIASIPLAFVHPLISFFLFVFVAILWFIPDKNIEKVLNE